MKYLFLALAIIVLSGCVGTPKSAEQSNAEGQIDPTDVAPVVFQGQPADLPDLGEAPELTNEIWLNTTKPLRLANLRGQVILLDMWTYG